MAERHRPWNATDWVTGLVDAPRLDAVAGLALLEERAQIGAHVPAGWQDLCGALGADLEVIAAGFSVAQVKEKFGTLRVYAHLPEGFDGDEALLRGAVFDARIRAAEQASAVTCQECGGAGSLRRLGGWQVTCCVACADRLTSSGGRQRPPLRRDVRTLLDEAFPDSQLGSLVAVAQHQKIRQAMQMLERDDLAPQGRELWQAGLERAEQTLAQLS